VGTEYAFGPPELRKQEKKDATPLAGAAAEPAGESKLPAAAGNSPAANDNGAAQELEERPTKRRKAERVATLTHSVAGTAPAESCDVQLAVETLPRMLPDIVEATGLIKHDRCMSLIEPLLSLAMLRGIKRHEMRPQKWKSGAYFLHTGQKKTPPEFASMLAQEWPTAPDSKTLPRGAIYGIAWYDSPVAAETLSQDPWHKFGNWGMAVVRAVEFTEPVTGVSGKMGPWRLQDEAIKAKILAALGCGTLRTFRT